MNAAQHERLRDTLARYPKSSTSYLAELLNTSPSTVRAVRRRLSPNGEPVPVISSALIKEALRKRYPPPEFAFFEEVRNRTGYATGVEAPRERYADAIALGLFPSAGLPLIGFEVKVSRADWLRELKDATKANAVQRYCDRWYVVAPAGTVRRDELPKGWGCLDAMWAETPQAAFLPLDSEHALERQPRTIELREKASAPMLQAVDLDRAFVASLVRKIHSGGLRSERVREALEGFKTLMVDGTTHLHVHHVERALRDMEPREPSALEYATTFPKAEEQ